MAASPHLPPPGPLPPWWGVLLSIAGMIAAGGLLAWAASWWPRYRFRREIDAELGPSRRELPAAARRRGRVHTTPRGAPPDYPVPLTEQGAPMTLAEPPGGALAARGLTRLPNGAFAPLAAGPPETAPLNGANVQKRHAVRPAFVLTPAEARAIITAVPLSSSVGVRDRALLMLLYRSGLRISEALALVPGDVDLSRHTARLGETKSGEPQTRPVDPGADDALVRWIERRKTLSGLRGAPLFCALRAGVAGRPLNRQQVSAMMKRAARAAGVDKDVRPHIWRHTFAVEMQEGGASVTVISKALGHSSIAVTNRYLDHLTAAEVVDAVIAANLPTLEGL